MFGFLGTVVMAGAIVVSVVVAGVVILVGRAGGGGLSSARRAKEAEDARLVQEIYQGLTRLEERVESLETLLLDGGERDAERRR